MYDLKIYAYKVKRDLNLFRKLNQQFYFREIKNFIHGVFIIMLKVQNLVSIQQNELKF